MMGMRGMVFKAWAALVLLLAGNAAAYKVHILNPWAGDPQRTKVYIVSSIIPGMAPPGGVPMTDEGNGWFTYDFGSAKPAANAEFYFGSFIPTKDYEFSGAAYFYGTPSTFNMG